MWNSILADSIAVSRVEGHLKKHLADGILFGARMCLKMKDHWQSESWEHWLACNFHNSDMCELEESRKDEESGAQQIGGLVKGIYLEEASEEHQYVMNTHDIT